MAAWEDIYRQYLAGGEAWASLQDGMHPDWVRWVVATTFPQKSVLDVGCGQGQYLQYLSAQQWQGVGIDNSPTAVQMARTALPLSIMKVVVADMNNYDYASQQYGLVMSIAAVHHGDKKTAAATLGQFPLALQPAGWLFVTVPAVAALSQWATFKSATAVADGVWAPTIGPEAGVPHCFWEAKELQNIFGNLQHVQISLDERWRWVVIGQCV